ENARPALRPACDWIAGLGQAGADNHRLLARSQEARLELSGGVGSLPREPRWNAGRRSAPRRARAAPDGADWWGGVCRRSACLVLLASGEWRVANRSKEYETKNFHSLFAIRHSLAGSRIPRSGRAPSLIEPKPVLPPGLFFGVTRSRPASYPVPCPKPRMHRIARTRLLVSSCALAGADKECVAASRICTRCHMSGN